MIMSLTAIANHHAWSFCENPLKIQEIKHAVDEFIEAELSVHTNKYWLLLNHTLLDR